MDGTYSASARLGKSAFVNKSTVAMAEILEFTPPHTLENEIIVRAVQSKAVWILALQSYYCDEKKILITAHKQDELKMFEYFAGCFLLEATVLCSMSFIISMLPFLGGEGWTCEV